MKFLAIDNGGFSTCVCDGENVYVLPSSKGLYRGRNLVSRHGDSDYVLEVGGEKFLMGTLADESKFQLEMYTDSKAHKFYDLSVLLAVALYGGKENIVMVSVPISQHNDREKGLLRDRLKGFWELEVNGEKKSFRIEDVLVAPETVSSFWLEQFKGKIRWIDWGSRTVGFGTTINENNVLRFLDLESGTFEKFGMGAREVEEEEVEYLAEFVAGRLLAKWDKNDRVINIGGGVYRQGLIESMQKYFKNSEVVKNPQTYLVKAMYVLGERVLERGV